MVSRQWSPQEGCCWLRRCQIAWSADIHQDIKVKPINSVVLALWSQFIPSVPSTAAYETIRESPVVGAAAQPGCRLWGCSGGSADSSLGDAEDPRGLDFLFSRIEKLHCSKMFINISKWASKPHGERPQEGSYSFINDSSDSVNPPVIAFSHC